MTENTDPANTDPDAQDGDEEPELPDIDTRVASFLYSRTGADHDDVRVALQDPDIIRGTEVFAGELLAELDERDGQLAEQAAEVERQRLASDREAMKEALKKELADQAVTTAKTTEEQRVRDELLGEIAAEEAAAAGEPTTGPEDALYVEFEESLAIVRDPKATPDQRLEAANRGIEAARQLEIAAPDAAPVDFDPDEFLQEFNASKEATR